MTNEITLIIPDDTTIHGAGERIDQALARLLPDYSRTQIKAWIDSGHILVNGKTIKAKTRVKGGETVTVRAELKPQPAWEAQSIPLTIIHEDDDLLVINKPVGLVVHPGAGNQDNTLLNALLHHAPQMATLPRAGILHRLDKDTSGLLVVAKTATALRSLTLQMKKRQITREYKAIVYGRLISGGRIDAPVGRHPTQRTRMAVTESGKPAITHYRIDTKFRHHTLLKVFLETGRTHQIRVHFAHIRHPIVGDPLYGGRTQLAKNMSTELIECIRGLKRQALHAFALTFRHPLTGDTLHFEAPLPDDMLTLIQLLKTDLNT